MKKKYIQRVSHYQVFIENDEISIWGSYIRQNTPLTPEIAGLLMGRAKPVWEDILCEVCKKAIEEGTEAKLKPGDIIKMRPDAHQDCYDKEMEKYRKENGL